MLKQAKTITLRLLKGMGLLTRVADSSWRRRRLMILCYHGVSLVDEHEWDPCLYISPAAFRRRLEILREDRFTVLPLGEALMRLRNGDLPPRSASITFDDGFHDFFAVAYPILEEFGYPATVYLSTYYSEFQRPVFDPICSYVLWKGRGRVIPGEAWTGDNRPMDLTSPASRGEAHQRILRFVRSQHLSARAKDGLAERLAQELGVDFEDIRRVRIAHMMSAAELSRMSPAIADIQLHTHRHRTPHDREAFLREIEDNRASLARVLGPGHRAVHFCYPSGHYSPQFIPWLAESGVVSATTCDPGLAARNSNPFLLPRHVDTSSVSEIEFEGWLSGVAQWLPHRRRAVPAQVIDTIAGANEPRTG